VALRQELPISLNKACRRALEAHQMKEMAGRAARENLDRLVCRSSLSLPRVPALRGTPFAVPPHGEPNNGERPH
jgi:hypothetical protein